MCVFGASPSKCAAQNFQNGNARTVPVRGLAHRTAILCYWGVWSPFRWQIQSVSAIGRVTALVTTTSMELAKKPAWSNQQLKAYVRWKFRFFYTTVGHFSRYWALVLCTASTRTCTSCDVVKDGYCWNVEKNTGTHNFNVAVFTKVVK